MRGPEAYGIIYDRENRRLTYLPTGRVVDLDQHDWIKGYIPDWATVEWMLSGMGKPEQMVDKEEGDRHKKNKAKTG